MDKRDTLLDLDNLPISIEPDGNQCRLVITIGWDELEFLLSKVVHKIDPHKAAKRRAAEEKDLFDARLDDKRRQFRELGQVIVETVQSYRDSGHDNKTAWLLTADDHEMSVERAEAFATLFRRHQAKTRKTQVIAEAKNGLSVRQIAEKIGISKSTVSNVLRDAGIKLPRGRKRKLRHSGGAR